MGLSTQKKNKKKKEKRRRKDTTKMEQTNELTNKTKVMLKLGR